MCWGNAFFFFIALKATQQMAEYEKYVLTTPNPYQSVFTDISNLRIIRSLHFTFLVGEDPSTDSPSSRGEGPGSPVRHD
jgi:hypothetical protein